LSDRPATRPKLSIERTCSSPEPNRVSVEPVDLLIVPPASCSKSEPVAFFFLSENMGAETSKNLRSALEHETLEQLLANKQVYSLHLMTCKH
jgi:hypothetical protein